MKTLPIHRRIIQLLLILPCLFAWLVSSAQADKTYTITTKTKPDDLSSYQVVEEENQIKLLFIKKGRKADIYNNFVFDTDLNLISTEEEEMEKAKAKSKYSFWDLMEQETVQGNTQILKDNLLTVENNMTGQMLIKKGYIGVNVNTNPVSGKKQTSVGFVTTEKIKPRTEDNRKLMMVTFRTDMPSEEFNASFTTGNGRTIGGSQKKLSQASGDVLIVASLLPQSINGPQGRELILNCCMGHVVMKYSAATLDKISEANFSFPSHTELIYQQDAQDGTNDLMMIFAPGLTSKQFVNPNKREYSYVRVSRDAKVKEQIIFESPFYRLNSISINTNGSDTYIMATGDSKGKEKYFALVRFENEDDQLAVIKLSNGKKEFTSLTNISDLAGNFSGADGVKPFNGAGFQQTNFLSLSDNSLFITGQGYEVDKENKKNYGSFYAFNISTDGKVIRHYAMPAKEDNALSKSTLASQMLIPGSDQSLFWTVLEFTKKADAYPKYVTIGLTNKGISPITIPGNGQYFVNDNFPAYFFKEKKQMFFFGNSDDNKKFWLHKVNF